LPRTFVAWMGFVLSACAQSERARPAAVEVEDTAPAVITEDTARVVDTFAAIETATPIEASVDSAVIDSFVEPPPDVTTIDKCTGPYAAFATKGLVAGGMTPSAFAKAYNLEVAALKAPGPMLLAFKGVDSSESSKWRLRVGGADAAAGEAKFIGPTAEVNYTLRPGIALDVPDQLASFKLRFDKSQIAVSGIRMTATAGDCSEISVDQLWLMIPESAGGEPFGDKTVSELMGAPIKPDGGTGFWILELLGSEKRVIVSGGVP
jgi:hypothetical protein